MKYILDFIFGNETEELRELRMFEEREKQITKRFQYHMEKLGELI